MIDDRLFLLHKFYAIWRYKVDFFKLNNETTNYLARKRNKSFQSFIKLLLVVQQQQNIKMSNNQTQNFRKKITSLNSFSSFLQLQQLPSQQKVEVIPSLISKFVNLSSQIQIEHNVSSFNLIDYDEKDRHVSFDHHIQTAKLRRIENNAELKRANMELFLMKNKMHKIKQQRKKQLFFKVEANNHTQNQYKDIFKTFAQSKNPTKLEEDNESFEDQEESSKKIAQKPLVKSPEGILYFDQLQKHPKILSYTLLKIKEKNMKTQRQKYEKRDRKIKFRNQMRTVSHSQPRMANRQKFQPSASDDAQTVFENIFRRIYTKKNTNKSLSQARKNQRLNKFIVKQDEILDGINQKSLSKQNYKKLKQRFNGLLGELYQLDKKHKIQQNNQKKINQTISVFGNYAGII